MIFQVNIPQLILIQQIKLFLPSWKILWILVNTCLVPLRFPCPGGTSNATGGKRHHREETNFKKLVEYLSRLIKDTKQGLD